MNPRNKEGWHKEPIFYGRALLTVLLCTNGLFRQNVQNLKKDISKRNDNGEMTYFKAGFWLTQINI